MKLLSTGFNKLFFNSTWMLAEQILRIISGLFVGVYIARYLGPENFGVLNYALAVSTFLIATSRLGMQAILIRELTSHNETQAPEILGTAFWMMEAAAFVFFTIAACIIIFTENSTQIAAITLVLCSSVFFSSFLVIDYHYQAKTKSKISSICKSSSIALTSLLKIFLVYIEAELELLVFAFLAEHIITALILFSVFKYKSSLSTQSVTLNKAKELFKSCTPMLLATISGILIVKTDQIMIRLMLGMKELGVYSAAVKIYEAWIILPFIISLSLLPILVKLKKTNTAQYERTLMHIFRYTIIASLTAIALASIFGEQVILLTFGEEYKDSYIVLLFSMWTALFVSIGSISGRYFTVEGYEKKVASRTFIALITNVLLNLILIPRYGINGAAVAGLIAMFVSAYLLDWTDNELKRLTHIKHCAMLPFLKI